MNYNLLFLQILNIYQYFTLICYARFFQLSKYHYTSDKVPAPEPAEVATAFNTPDRQLWTTTFPPRNLCDERPVSSLERNLNKSASSFICFLAQGIGCDRKTCLFCRLAPNQTERVVDPKCSRAIVLLRFHFRDHFPHHGGTCAVMKIYTVHRTPRPPNFVKMFTKFAKNGNSQSLRQHCESIAGKI